MNSKWLHSKVIYLPFSLIQNPVLAVQDDRYPLKKANPKIIGEQTRPFQPPQKIQVDPLFPLLQQYFCCIEHVQPLFQLIDSS